MRRSDLAPSQFQSINLQQWRQDINTFVHEMQGELEQIIDEISNSFLPAERFGLVNPQGKTTEGLPPLQQPEQA